jgi:hypothetical protein
MEVFQNLKIFLNHTNDATLKEHLVSKAKSINWIHRLDFEENYRKNTATESDTILCIETLEMFFNSLPIKGYIWLWKKNNYFEIFNIIPTKPGSFSYSQYNYILNQFFLFVVSDVVLQLGLQTESSKPNKSIEEIIGKDAAESLIRFSKGANKVTGNTHPYDFDRWCEFVFIIFREKIPLNIDEFVRWLKDEENWSDEMAWKLGIDLEYALDILEKYEHN